MSTVAARRRTDGAFPAWTASPASAVPLCSGEPRDDDALADLVEAAITR